MYLLPHFFKHYEWADKIIIYDNGSDDGSQDFIKAQPKGELRHYDTNDKHDEETLVSLRNNCWKGDTSDWVIICDTDEHLIGHEKLKDYVGELCVFNCKSWEMVSEEVPADFADVTLKYHEPWWLYKCLCFNPRITEINYKRGSHRCKPVPHNKVSDVLEFYHYSSLSEDYLVEKQRKIASRMSENNLKLGFNTPFWKGDEKAVRKEFRRRLKLAKNKVDARVPDSLREKYLELI